MTLKIEIRGEHTRGDTALWLQEIVNAVRAGRLDPDIRKPIRDFNGREIGYAVMESDIKWPDPLTLRDE